MSDCNCLVAIQVVLAAAMELLKSVRIIKRQKKDVTHLQTKYLQPLITALSS